MIDLHKIKIIHYQQYNESGRPYLHLEFLDKSGKWITIPVKFDSGADNNIFGKKIADQLGITKIENDYPKEFTTANNQTFTAYEHKLFFQVPGHNDTILLSVYFTPTITKKELLGRDGFLEEIGVIMDAKRIYLFI